MSLAPSRSRKKVLAVASGGGHWVQLLRLAPALVDFDVTFVGVSQAYRSEVAEHKFYSVTDATRWDKIAMLKSAVQLAWIIWREKPDVVVSTGAAPGYFAIRLGRLFGARTIWLDSIANADCLSMAGELVGRYADLWLTQWPHLDRAEGPHYRGAVL
jgi:UDP-N-acetylglucosamine:LPS N-acetylglucosamine transferase